MRTREQKIAELPPGTELCPTCAGDGFTGWSWGTKDTCTNCGGMGWVHPAPARLHPCANSRFPHIERLSALSAQPYSDDGDDEQPSS